MGIARRVNKASFGGGSVLVLAVASSLGLFSCSFVTDFNQVQCKVAKDCAELGQEFKYGECVDGLCQAGPECRKDEECASTEGCVEERCVDRWSCLDEKVPAATEEVAFQVPVASIFGDPMPGVPVQLCQAVDTDCTTPVDELVSDENGLIAFEVPANFRGYLDTKVPGFFPQINFLPDVLTNPSFQPPLSLSPVEIIEALAQQVGDTADPDRGHLVVSVASCVGSAPGLVISSGRADEKAIPYYVSASVPAPDRTSTTEEGSGGFLNLVVGTGELKITSGDGERELFSRNVFTRKGTITTVHFQPAALTVAQVNQDGD